ncbi:hypothetical protein ACE6H2_026465 [Prunus campanulata]
MFSNTLFQILKVLKHSLPKSTKFPNTTFLTFPKFSSKILQISQTLPPSLKFSNTFLPSSNALFNVL